MTLHREGPAGPTLTPSRNALFLLTWLVACALGVSGAIDGARAFEPALPSAAPGTPIIEGPGEDVLPAAAKPDDGVDPAVEVSDDEQRRLDDWEEYVASLAGGHLPPAEDGSPAVTGGPSDRGEQRDRGPREPHPGLVRPPVDPADPADPPAPVDPVAPVEPPSGSPLDGLLAPVSGLLGGVLGLLGGAPPRS